jgi:IS5 family transposase
MIDLFAIDTQLRKLTKLGDPLEKINEIVDWEIFREPIEKAIRRDMSKGGRPPFDVVFMFKILMLQQWNNLSDESTEFLINDRLSYQRFLNLDTGDKVPDKNTLWDFKEDLRKSGIETELFKILEKMLEEKNLITHEGSIIDATFVTVPKRHTTKKDDEALKKNEEPEDLLNKTEERETKEEIKDQKHILSQMDMDARWTKKNNECFFGYKNHVKCDSESKLITTFTVTNASTHDSQVFVELIDEKDRDIKVDSGYSGEKYKKAISEQFPNLELHICSRAYRNKDLTEENKESNKLISRIRCRIEHIFGYMTRFMGGLVAKCHGIERIKSHICNKNIAYNLKRYVYLMGQTTGE